MSSSITFNISPDKAIRFKAYCARRDVTVSSEIGEFVDRCLETEMQLEERAKRYLTSDKVLRDRVEELENAIRKHRDRKIEHRCWRDDEALYSVLPEGYSPPKKDVAIELDYCELFIKSRYNPRIKNWVSPFHRIAVLEKILEIVQKRLKNKKVNLKVWPIPRELERKAEAQLSSEGEHHVQQRQNKDQTG